MFIKKYTLTLALSLITPFALYSAIATNNDGTLAKDFFDTYDLLDQATDGKHQLLYKLEELKQNKEAVLALKDQNDRTLLQCAAFKGNLNVAQFLINLGAPVNQKASFEITPLCAAAKANQLEMAQFLIASGADINTQDTDGWSPLHCALGHNKGLPMMELLLSKGADKGLKTTDGQTPLHIAITHAFQNENYPTFAAFLKDETIDVNTQDEEGNTALHLAASQKLPLFIKTLLDHPSVRLDVKNKTGKTALELATDRANDACVKLLTAAAISKTSKPRI